MVQFRTFYGYDYSAVPNEVNSGEVITNTLDYESLGQKLLRFTALNIPISQPSGDQYGGDDYDITDEPGFDIADYPLHEKNEDINNSLTEVKKDEKVVDENVQGDSQESVASSSVPSGGEADK